MGAKIHTVWQDGDLVRGYWICDCGEPILPPYVAGAVYPCPVCSRTWEFNYWQTPNGKGSTRLEPRVKPPAP